MRILKLLFCLLPLLSSCREDEYVTYMTNEDTGVPIGESGFAGLYILNEGNMGANRCTLDFLDLSGNDSTIHYYRNIYAERNPGTVKELGDVGNDIGIYGSKLWMVVNCSNKVEVCEAATAKRIGQANIDNCRYLAFDNGFAYVSSYAGPVQVAENCSLGRVYKVDTLTLQKVDSVVVGYQPEEMAIVNGKLYVANSGGYRVPTYDNRVSVIDLETFRVVRDIEVDINMHRLQADRFGQIWVSTRGNYYDVKPALYCISNNEVAARLDLTVSAMTIVGDSLYYIGTAFNYAAGGYMKSFGIVDVKRCATVATDIFEASEIKSISLPYGIIVNPFDKSFYLMDAKNYVSSGELLHFDANGHFLWRVATGDIPSRGAFLRKDERGE
ncbi:MAG: YncE family protein [Bacteroidales bacterium]|nr:YncE family protein [Bacteroidales bacterium]